MHHYSMGGTISAEKLECRAHCDHGRGDDVLSRTIPCSSGVWWTTDEDVAEINEACIDVEDKWGVIDISKDYAKDTVKVI